MLTVTPCHKPLLSDSLHFIAFLPLSYLHNCSLMSKMRASLVAQLVKNLSAMWETWVRSCVGKIPWRRNRLPTPVFMGFPGGSDGKESTCSAGDLALIPGLGRFPGGGHGNPLQYSCLENPYRQRNLVGYSPWGHKESDMTE